MMIQLCNVDGGKNIDNYLLFVDFIVSDEKQFNYFVL